MRSIKGSLTHEIATRVGDEPVARAEAYPVDSFRALVEQVARLSYLNKDHLLFFRGQAEDYRNKAGSSTLYPTIYRGERVTKDQLDLAFTLLNAAAAQLCDLLDEKDLSSRRDVRRRRWIQWSILQHYEVCPTPLLDLTHSLRVACSFAFLASAEEPHVFVLGLPYVTNRISVNSEHDLVNIRLLSICPPEALRPYFQEGYLAGTDDVMADFESKTELDFNNRLVAKFRLSGGRERFWADGFRPYPREVLYPPQDEILELCEGLKADLDVGAAPGLIGGFLQSWTELESLVMSLARDAARDTRIYSLRSALEVLLQKEAIPFGLGEAIDEVRRVRNEVVHRPSRLSAQEVARTTARIRGLVLDVRQGTRER